MQNFVIIAGCLALGMLVQRFGRLPAHAPLKLNQFVINFTLPAVILLNIPSLTMKPSLLFPMFAGWLAAASCAMAVLLASRLAGWSKSVTGSLLLVAVLGNTSYLGFPMVVSLFGHQGLGYAIIYDQLGNFVPLATYGTIICALYAHDGQRPSVLTIVGRIVSFPPFVALVFALCVPVTYPGWFETALQWIAITLMPLTMFIIGLQFRLKVDKEDRLPLITGLTIKLLLAPLVVLLVGMAIGQKDLILAVTVFEAAMPTMVTAGAMAIASNLAPRLAIAMVGIGLLCAFLILPLYASALTWLLL